MVQHVALWQPPRSVPEAIRRQLVDPSCVAPWQPKLLRSTPAGGDVSPSTSAAQQRGRMSPVATHSAQAPRRRTDPSLDVAHKSDRFCDSSTRRRRYFAIGLDRTHRQGARTVSPQRRRGGSLRYQPLSTELRMVDESSAPMRRGRWRAGAMSSIHQKLADHDHDALMRARGSE
jgi:hypothetical protein